MTTYTACRTDLEPTDEQTCSDWSCGEPLTARTDIGARRQAKKIAKARGWGSHTVRFFRSEDSCRGEI